jgi:sec-independent protein translocase protein TatA
MGLDNPVHIIFIVLILLLIFGARRLPEIGRSLGTGMREFKQSITGEDHNHHQQAPTLAPGSLPGQAPVQTPPPQATAPAAPEPEPATVPAQPVAVPPAPSTEGSPAPVAPQGSPPQG